LYGTGEFRQKQLSSQVDGKEKGAFARTKCVSFLFSFHFFLQ